MNDLKSPVISCLVERCVLSEGRYMNKSALCFIWECTIRRKVKGCVQSHLFVLAQVQSWPVLMFYMLFRRRSSGSKVVGSEGRGDIMASFLWGYSASTSGGLDQWSKSFVGFSHLHHCHDNSGFDGIIWFPNEDMLLIIWLKRFTVVCLWHPFKSTTCPSDSCKLDLKKHTCNMTIKSAAGLWAA